MLFFILLAQTIAFYTFPTDQPWDSSSTKKGITGSEEAVIYVSEKLADLGNQVIVYGHPTRLFSEEENPRYVKLDPNNLPKTDIAISWRMHDLAPQLKKLADKIYFWPHDVCTLHIPTEQIEAFDDVLWLSEWQRAQWISLNPAFARFPHVFGNGINPTEPPPPPRKNPYACIYGSNYGRGLEILLNIWPIVKSRFPLATLDIYYGWQHWGTLTPKKEQYLRKQVKELKYLDVQEHGLVSHEELTAAYEKASLWTYPCTHPETFCITALRAQFAGAVPVIISSAALKETVPHGFQCASPAQYLQTLLHALEQAPKITDEHRSQMREFILDRYTWEKIAKQWHELFSSS